MSVAEKLTTIAENVPKVFEAGQRAEHTAFWDSFQNPTLSYWACRFAGNGWNDYTFKPTQNIVATGNSTGMFRETKITNLKQCLENCGVSLDTSKATNVNTFYGYSTALTTVPKTDLSSISVASSTAYLFQDDRALETIEELNVSEKTAFHSTSFNGCTALKRLIMTGTLATNGLNLQWSTQLDHESLLSILNCLKDYSDDTSGTDWFITIGANNIVKLSEEEKLIATNKGWDIR